MTRTIRYAMAASAFVVMAAAPRVASAQIQVGTKVGTPPPPSAPGAGHYESLGRRDPFNTLVVRRSANPTVFVPRASHGLGSFLLTDVMVTGIVRNGKEMTCILQGADKQGYVAKVGSKIADAVIKSIDGQGVVFVDMPQPGVVRPQETRKLLRQAAGDNR